MIAKKMGRYLDGDSAIRAMFEEGNRLIKIHGKENVFDFSLGNPNFPAPKEIHEAIIDTLEKDPVAIHGYMNNMGYPHVREEIANDLNKKHGTAYTSENIVMTVGAAGGLNIVFKSLLDPDDEIITFAPFFAEYKNYARNFDAKLKVVQANRETFQPNISEFEKLITEKTKIVLINTPNNPSGVVYKEEAIKELTEVLKKKEEEYNKAIYIFSDEPYRELIYDDCKFTYIPSYYKNTIVGYSWSKSLSIPGERIGYLTIPNEVADYANLINALSVATRVLGFVNAPALSQNMVAQCLNNSVNIEAYNKNRIKLYEGLREIGYECVKPEGAFYLFVKTPIEDDVEFCNKAKEYNILLVPGSGFGCPSYVRIAYCVSYDTIERSLQRFKKLYDDLK